MEARRPKNPTEMEGKNSGSRAGKLRSYRRKRRGIHRRSHNSFSSNARSEAFSGCHAGCHGKLYSRRFLGIFRLEQRWTGHIVRLGSHSPPIDGMSDVDGTFRTWRDVRVESVMRATAEISQ